MSITTTTKHVLKKRKLSHDTAKQGQLPAVRSSHKDDTLDDPDSDKGFEPHIQTFRNSRSNKKSSANAATGEMTKSSLMQIQLDELLEEIRPDYDHFFREAKQSCDNLIQIIKSAPPKPALPIYEVERSLRKHHGISVPFGSHRPSPDAKYNFEYKPSDRIVVRGGLVQRLSTKHDQSIEVAVQMPADLFQEKDHLNYRALHKRACYLACIAGHMKEVLQNKAKLQYDLRNGNDLVPIISLVYPKDTLPKALSGVRFVVNVVFPENVGPIDKTLPDRSCLRTTLETTNKDSSQAKPTPVYNSTIRSLAATQQVDKLVEQAARKCEAFTGVCSIGQTWLRQRGFSSDRLAGGFGLWEWAHVCALLLHAGGHRGHPLFSERYSTLQLFKAMLQVLATRDLTDPLLVRAQSLQLPKDTMPILYDGATGINVFSNMSGWSYELLRHQAQLSLAALNSRAQDSFDSTFIAKIAQTTLQFDEVYTINLSSTANRNSFAMQLYNVLKRGLGDRVTLMHLQECSPSSWTLDSGAPKRSKHAHLLEIHLLTNADANQRLIDHGPTAEQQEEAREFRKFWGEKSELRRFRDGSITETLVWSSASPVTLQILQYLCAYHFQIVPSSVVSKNVDLQAMCLASNASINADDAFKLISNKYQELSTKLHQMEGLPLPIRSVSSADQALRSASSGHPLDSTTSMPIDVLIQFDSSTRWPDHLLAIQHTKVAFLAKISDLVLESDSSLSTRLGIEDTNSSDTQYHNTSFLDIVFPSAAPGVSPIVFRLRIHHERELQLLQTQLADKTLSPPMRDILSSALLEHKRTFIASPSHTGSLRNLITHFTPLSTTIRLLKSWCASHNLSNHILDPVLEIIAAHVFLHPYPWSTPGHVTIAFLRCLHFLSHWDWASTPLIVDLSLSQDITSAQLTELETRYQAWRRLDPNMNTVAWFIGTNIDNTGTIWTQGAKPARVVAGRITALAKAAIELIKVKGLDMKDEDWKSLFVSPTTDFDFVIHLKSSVVRGGKKSHRNGDVKFKNLQVQQDLDVDSIGHDVVALYLADLEKAFANVALFFHGERGKRIAGLWRPSVTGRRDWKVRLGYSSIPYAGQDLDDEGEVKDVAVVNKDAILAEMTMLGEGMIEKISVKN